MMIGGWTLERKSAPGIRSTPSRKTFTKSFDIKFSLGSTDPRCLLRIDRSADRNTVRSGEGTCIAPVSCFSEVHRDVARAPHEAPLGLLRTEIISQGQPIQSPPFVIE